MQAVGVQASCPSTVTEQQIVGKRFENYNYRHRDDSTRAGVPSKNNK